MAHGVVTRTRMASEYNGNLRLAGKYYSTGTTEADIDNGNVVEIGSFISGEAELRTFSKPTAKTAKGAIGLVTTPEIEPDERLKNLEDFYNKKGKPITVDILTSGDVFKVTTDALSGTATVDYVAEMQADTKIKIVQTATSGSTTIGKVVEVTGDVVTILVG